MYESSCNVRRVKSLAPGSARAGALSTGPCPAPASDAEEFPAEPPPASELPPPELVAAEPPTDEPPTDEPATDECSPPAACGAPAWTRPPAPAALAPFSAPWVEPQAASPAQRPSAHRRNVCSPLPVIEPPIVKSMYPKSDRKVRGREWPRAVEWLSAQPPRPNVIGLSATRCLGSGIGLSCAANTVLRKRRSPAA